MNKNADQLKLSLVSLFSTFVQGVVIGTWQPFSCCFLGFMFLLDIQEIWMKKDGGRARNVHGMLYNMKIKTKPNQLFLFLHFQSHFHRWKSHLHSFILISLSWGSGY